LNLAFRSPQAQSPGYRADIDGLRAVAVLYVVFYHLGLLDVPGGFVGVDVFFTISGYLITQVIQRQIDRGSFSVLWFYDRRIRRIFPALFAMVLTCSLLALRLFPPAALLRYGKTLLYLTGFVSNLYFKQLDIWGGYFGTLSRSQVLLHTWSLSVEEQFYLFYPVALLLLNRLARRHRAGILLLCTTVSFAAAVQGVKLHPLDAFYLLPSRAWELLLGAFLALKLLPAMTARVARELAAAAGLGMIAYAAKTLTLDSPFPGFNALWPCVGAGLILYAGESGESVVSWCLGLPPVVFVGVISYSLYLWHWPSYILFRYFNPTRELEPRDGWVLFLVSLGLAVLSFEFIERPFRRRSSTLGAKKTGAKKTGAKKTVWLAAGVSAALASLALVILRSDGMPNRFDAHTRQLLADNDARSKDRAMPGACTNFRTPIAHYSDVVFCGIGQSSNNVLVWGDSHSEQLYAVMQQLQPELHGQGVVFATAAGCQPSEHFNAVAPGFSCDRFARFAIQRAMQGDIDTVLIVFSPRWYWNSGLLCASEDGRCIEMPSDAEVRRRTLADLTSTIRALRASGKRVIVGLPFPIYDRLIPEFESGVAIVGRRWMAGEPVEESAKEPREALQALARDTGADLYDPREALCGGGKCVYQVNGVSLYIDNGHLAPSQTGILKQGLLKALTE
jgi:peptidoglycan/LPS O-acetylase OafA/YrhL